ncbi:MAG TPA: hypothetical protein VJJ48_00815 [Candidatus Paceibacterota bacterium]
MAQVVTIILHDDNPQGLRSIELDNWQGKIFIITRASLKDFRENYD